MSNSVKNQIVLTELSIIIPVYKDLDGLKNTLTDLRKSLIPVAFEIIVCNDGASPLVSDWLADQGLIEMKIKKQKGSYYARNRGIEKAKSKWLLFVDAGVKVLPNWYDLIAEKFTKNSYIAFDINMIIDKNMSLMKKYSEFKEFRCRDYWEQNHFGPTAFLLVEKRIFNETGMFNEKLYSGGDFELGNRCWHANFKMTFVENAHIYHEPRSLWAKHKKQIRVLQGLKQLKEQYPNRLMQLPEITWKEFLKGPLKFLYTIKKIKTQPAVIQANWPFHLVIWAEYWHQKMYYWALLKVLTIKKLRFE